VADHDLSVQAEGGCPFQNQIERETRHLAGFMQMDIDRFGVTLREIEQDVELAHGVAVDRAGIEAADHIRALGQRGSMRSATPGQRTTPDWGNATICISIRSEKSARTFSIAWMWRRPISGSMSTWVRRRVVPLAR